MTIYSLFQIVFTLAGAYPWMAFAIVAAVIACLFIIFDAYDQGGI